MLPSSEYAVNIVTRFANVNVNKVNIFLRNRINSTCMLFLSMYTFINNNNILYLDTLSREETLFKGVYIGTIIGYTN